MTTKSSTQIKEEESFISDDVKNKLTELGNVLLHGMVLATGSLIVNGMAASYRDQQQKKLIASDPNVIDITERAANS